MNKLVSANKHSNLNENARHIEEDDEVAFQTVSSDTQINEETDLENHDSVYSSSLSSSSSNKINKVENNEASHALETGLIICNETFSTANSNLNLENLDSNNHYGTSSISDSDSSGGLNSSFSHTPNLEPNDDDQQIQVHVKQLLNELVDSIHSNKLSRDEIIKQTAPSHERLEAFEKLFNTLQFKLDDLRAFYIELNDFYELTQNYEKFFSKLFSNEKCCDELLTDDDENMSMTVNNVLQYFDFLNDVDNECEQSQSSSTINLRVKKLSITETDVTMESNASFTRIFNNNSADLSYLFDFDSLLSIHFSNCLRILDVSIEYF